MADRSIDVCLFNGGIRTSEQEYMAQLLRRKAKVLVAFGSCASEGCIPGLGNLNTRQEIFDTVYKEKSATTPENPQDIRPQAETKVPEGTLHLPIFYDTLKTLDQTVDVDYYLPGCPPEAENIWTAIVAILEGKLPPKGAVIGMNTTVCDECPRKRDEKKIKKFYRTWQIIPDEETCLLEQGLLCCGIATRAGCKALCPQVNSPCIGCHGAERRRGRLRRPADERRGLGDRLERSGRDRPDHQRGDSRPGGQFLPLQPGRQPVAAEEEGTKGQLTKMNRGCRSASIAIPFSGRRHAGPEPRTMKRISIDPITRLEGHGKIDIFLDDQGDVANAYLQIPELRGFEQFCVGRPAEDMPNLTARICGVCPEAHHMAATKALDALFHVDPPPAAKKLRELFYSIFYATDHTTHFYALGGPDFVVGPTAPPAQRNILGVVAKVGMDVAKHVLKMRHDGHALIQDDGRPRASIPTGACPAASAAASTKSSARKSRPAAARPSSSPSSR